MPRRFCRVTEFDQRGNSSNSGDTYRSRGNRGINVESMDTMNDSDAKHPLASLTREHRLIRRMVDALEGFAEKLEMNEPADLRDLGHFAAFFGEFGEGIHHVKEEDYLLPAMVKKGFEWDQGPVGKVRAEHAQERYLVRVLRQAAEQEGDWSEEARRHAIASIRAFIDFQRRHMDREDNLLYPAVSQRLTLEELAALDTQLAQFDDQHGGETGRKARDALAVSLVEKYGSGAASVR